MMANWWIRIKYALPTKALLLLVILILVTLPIICWNLQYSAFFIPGDINYAGFLKRTENNRRIAEARSYFSQIKGNTTIDYHSSSTSILTNQVTYPSIAFMIIAADRNRREIDNYQPSYLMQTAHTLWRSVDKDLNNFGSRFLNLTLSLCDIDSISEKFYEMHYMSRFFERLPMNEKRSFENVNCRAKSHFLSCLSLLSKNHPTAEYVVVLEDDFLSKIDSVTGIAQVFDSLTKRFGKKIPDRLAFVQLYNPLHNIRYSVIDPDSLLEILAVSVPLASLLIVCYFRLHMRPMLPLYNVLLLIIILCVCVCVVIIIGRPHWQLLYHSFTRSYHLIGSLLSSSSAAVLIPREFVKDLFALDIDFVCQRDETNFQLMKTVARGNNKRILSVNINLFKHIGLYSSFKKAVLNAHIVE